MKEEGRMKKKKAIFRSKGKKKSKTESNLELLGGKGNRKTKEGEEKREENMRWKNERGRNEKKKD